MSEATSRAVDRTTRPIDDMMTHPVADGGTLRIDGLTRSFGDRTVLDDVSFEVRPGVLTGFIGANGAGKTTTMRIILGVLIPDAGTVHWQGARLDANARKRFGYMPEERGL